MKKFHVPVVFVVEAEEYDLASEKLMYHLGEKIDFFDDFRYEIIRTNSRSSDIESEHLYDGRRAIYLHNESEGVEVEE